MADLRTCMALAPGEGDGCFFKKALVAGKSLYDKACPFSRDGWQAYVEEGSNTHVPLMESRSQIASAPSQPTSLHSTADILRATLERALCVYEACKKKRRNDLLCMAVAEEPRDGVVVQHDVTPLCRSPDHDAGLRASRRLQADDSMFLLYHLCGVGAA